jgi:hypothetical protein
MNASMETFHTVGRGIGGP